MTKRLGDSVSLTSQLAKQLDNVLTERWQLGFNGRKWRYFLCCTSVFKISNSPSSDRVSSAKQPWMVAWRREVRVFRPKGFTCIPMAVRWLSDWRQAHSRSFYLDVDVPLESAMGLRVPASDHVLTSSFWLWITASAASWVWQYCLPVFQSLGSSEK